MARRLLPLVDHIDVINTDSGKVDRTYVPMGNTVHQDDKCIYFISTDGENWTWYNQYVKIFFIENNS